MRVKVDETWDNEQAGRLDRLDYKTLRYPGHYAWVESLLAKAPPDADPAEYLQREMEAAFGRRNV